MVCIKSKHPSLVSCIKVSLSKGSRKYFPDLNTYLVLVLRPLEHVVDDVVHLGHEPVQPDLEQHHDGAAHVLPHLGVLVAGQEEQVLDELVNVDHQRLAASDDELVDAGDGMTPDLGVVVAKKCEKLKTRTVMKSFN